MILSGPYLSALEECVEAGGSYEVMLTCARRLLASYRVLLARCKELEDENHRLTYRLREHGEGIEQ